MNVAEFKSVNDIADTFSGIKIKKMTDYIYNKTDFAIYREQLKENGYLLLRNVLSPSKISLAAGVVEEYLISNDYLTIKDGKEQALKTEGILLSGYKPITHHEKSVVEGTELKTIFSGIFAEECYTLETKWIRVLGPKEFTDTHSDVYRFRKIGLPLYTCWIPLMNQGIKEGCLALCQDSFKLDYDEEALDQQELPKGFLDIVDESTWLYSDFKIGDIVIFDIRTIHASFRNDSDTFRKNTDTRWLPKSLAKKSIHI